MGCHFMRAFVFTGQFGCSFWYTMIKFACANWNKMFRLVISRHGIKFDFTTPLIRLGLLEPHLNQEETSKRTQLNLLLLLLFFLRRFLFSSGLEAVVVSAIASSGLEALVVSATASKASPSF